MLSWFKKKKAKSKELAAAEALYRTDGQNAIDKRIQEYQQMLVDETAWIINEIYKTAANGGRSYYWDTSSARICRKHYLENKDILDTFCSLGFDCKYSLGFIKISGWAK